MYLAVPPQPDCASAWLEAVRRVDSCHGHEAHNVIIDVQDPIVNATFANPIVKCVDDFLKARDKSIDCIANTIFPLALYQRHGAAKFIEVFHKRVLPRVRRNQKWSGYYFERMTRAPDQLSDIIERIGSATNRSLNKFEMAIFDPMSDADGSPYGGQCLSFLSFHLEPGSPKTLLLTAQYRNHYYIEKLLGNLIGLGQLMGYVAAETNTKVGSLTVLSTHATIDVPKPGTRQDVTSLMDDCSKPSAARRSAA